MLLQQRHQEVDGQVDVLNQLVLSHVHVADGDVKAQDLKWGIRVDQKPWYESYDLVSPSSEVYKELGLLAQNMYPHSPEQETRLTVTCS